MAPALVERSASKERNSPSKKYLNSVGLIQPSFDLEINSKIKFVTDKTYTQKHIFGSNFKQSNIKIEKPSRFISEKGMSEAVTESRNVKTNKSSLSITTLNNTKILNSIASEDTSNIKNITQGTNTKLASTTEVRLPHPVATLDNVMMNQIYKRVGNKFLELNSNIYELNNRLRKFQFKNICSHVANEEKKDTVLFKAHSSEMSAIEELIDVTDAGKDIQPKQKSCQLERLYDLTSYLDDATDDESFLEPFVNQMGKKGKPKSECLPPPSDKLHIHKTKQAKLGSHCSWLSLKIPLLDQKIANLNDFYKQLRQEKTENKTITRTFHRNDEHKTKNVTSLCDHVPLCQRCLPVNHQYKHMYVRAPEKQHIYDLSCQSMQIKACKLCETTVSNTVNLLSKELDHCYHATLSRENDLCLSFKLEEVLRTQKINTRIDLSKSLAVKKKKKSIKSKGSQALNPLKEIEKEQVITKKSVPTKIKPPKTKNERSLSEENPRKRFLNEFSSTGRLRKVRKFSDSYYFENSSKPSTPTPEMNSPMSHLPTPSKQKKKNSSSADYDINNIVIPYSIAASTRLERIKYKEIPTPGWRNVVMDTVVERDCLLDDVELTDDEFYGERHARCEIQERKRFTNFVVTRKNRSNRVSECNTSEPPSPLFAEEHYRSSNFNTPVDSPNSGVTPLSKTPMALSALTPVANEERDPSWMERIFPLHDTDCKQLLIIDVECEKASFRYPGVTSIRSSPRCSPLPYSKHSSSMLCPDTQNLHADKGWAVKLAPDAPDVTPPEKSRKGIVLKLAKK